MNFSEAIETHWAHRRHICLGLDPVMQKLPPSLQEKGPDGIIEFNRQIIEATSDLVAAYKPQAAFYERLGLDGPRVLLETIQLIKRIAPNVPVLLDAKRGDIGSTNEAYVETIFDFYGAHATTIAPYLGPEASKPFTDRSDCGIFVLCRTSNPGADHYQHLDVGGEPLYVHIARDVANNWNYNNNCALVVGATAPSELAEVRKAATMLPILVPGIGAQGGDLQSTVEAGTLNNNMSLLISSSRELIYAFAKTTEPDQFATATRSATLDLNQKIEAARAGI